jgi:hypothetical protein
LYSTILHKSLDADDLELTVAVSKQLGGAFANLTRPAVAKK